MAKPINRELFDMLHPSEQGDVEDAQAITRAARAPYVPRVIVVNPRTPTATLDSWLTELALMPASPDRRALKQRLTQALIGDGMRAPNAKTLADKLIAERRREKNAERLLNEGCCPDRSDEDAENGKASL